MIKPTKQAAEEYLFEVFKGDTWVKVPEAEYGGYIDNGFTCRATSIDRKIIAVSDIEETEAEAYVRGFKEARMFVKPEMDKLQLNLTEANAKIATLEAEIKELFDHYNLSERYNPDKADGWFSKLETLLRKP